MGALLRATGTVETVVPTDSRRGFTLEEMYALIDCAAVEVVSLSGGRTLVLDEDGKFTGKVRNDAATRLLHEAGGMLDDFVVGDALVAEDGELL